LQRLNAGLAFVVTARQVTFIFAFFTALVVMPTLVSFAIASMLEQIFPWKPPTTEAEQYNICIWGLWKRRIILGTQFVTLLFVIAVPLGLL
jgi:hypothetical protein